MISEWYKEATGSEEGNSYATGSVETAECVDRRQEHEQGLKAEWGKRKSI